MDEAERQRLLTTHGNRSDAEETIRNITACSLPSTIFERTVDDNLRSSDLAWRAWLNHGSREDILAAMSNVAVPVLVVAGAADAAMTEEILEQHVVRCLTVASMKVTPNAGHLLPLEVPEAIADLIRGEVKHF